MNKLIDEKAKIVFLGTPEFAVQSLQALFAAKQFCDIIAVITQPDRPAGRNLEVQKSSIKKLYEDHMATSGKMGRKFPLFTPDDVNTEEMLTALEKMEPDLAVVVAYGQILKPDFLKLFKCGAVNIHASLLPKWRGAAPIAWSILNQDEVTGVSLQKIAPKLDSGPIIASSQVSMTDQWDAIKLYKELSKRGVELLRRALPDYLSGKLVPKRQDESQVTWAPKITREHGRIDWNKTAQEICAQIRALTPWPGTWTTRNGSILKILRADFVLHQDGKPGDLVGIDKIHFWVKCGEDTALKVSVVQPESRGRQPAADYLKGYPFQKGDRLGT